MISPSDCCGFGSTQFEDHSINLHQKLGKNLITYMCDLFEVKSYHLTSLPPFPHSVYIHRVRMGSVKSWNSIGGVE